MMFMPLIFGFMFYNFPSGLVLYYLTSNLVGIGQQWFFNKTSMATHVPPSRLEPPKKRTAGNRPVTERKYSVASIGLRIDGFLNATLQNGGLQAELRDPGCRAVGCRFRDTRTSW